MLTHWGEFQGTYELSASVNGKPSWRTQSTGIWYVQDLNVWMIGSLNDIGTPICAIFIAGTLFGANENGKWNYFIEKTWKKLDANDFSIECIDRKGTNQQSLI